MLVNQSVTHDTELYPLRTSAPLRLCVKMPPQAFLNTICEGVWAEHGPKKKTSMYKKPSTQGQKGFSVS